MRILLLSLVCVSLLACGCRKNRNNANGLVGVWLMTETYNLSSGWKKLPEAEQQNMEFRKDSTFKFTPPLISSSTGCTGAFRTQAELLVINWTCQYPAYDVLTVYTLNGNELMLDYVATSSGHKARYVRQ